MGGCVGSHQAADIAPRDNGCRDTPSPPNPNAQPTRPETPPLLFIVCPTVPRDPRGIDSNKAHDLDAAAHSHSGSMEPPAVSILVNGTPFTSVPKKDNTYFLTEEDLEEEDRRRDLKKLFKRIRTWLQEVPLYSTGTLCDVSAASTICDVSNCDNWSDNEREDFLLVPSDIHNKSGGTYLRLPSGTDTKTSSNEMSGSSPTPT